MADAVSAAGGGVAGGTAAGGASGSTADFSGLSQSFDTAIANATKLREIETEKQNALNIAKSKPQT